MSQFSDAIMAQMTASLDPTVAMTRTFMDVTIKEKSLQLDLLKTSGLDTVRTSRAKAVEDKASVSVLDAYDRIIKRLSSD